MKELHNFEHLVFDEIFVSDSPETMAHLFEDTNDHLIAIQAQRLPYMDGQEHDAGVIACVIKPRKLEGQLFAIEYDQAGL